VQGLSSDELQFIAAFLGAHVLEFSGETRLSRTGWAERIAQYQQACAACAPCNSEDREHKMILLLEYLCRSGAAHAAGQRLSATVRLTSRLGAPA
jgi:hypothetical protein